MASYTVVKGGIYEAVCLIRFLLSRNKGRFRLKPLERRVFSVDRFELILGHSTLETTCNIITCNFQLNFWQCQSLKINILENEKCFSKTLLLRRKWDSNGVWINWKTSPSMNWQTFIWYSFPTNWKKFVRMSDLHCEISSLYCDTCCKKRLQGL